MRKEFTKEVIELWLTDHIFSTLLSHPFVDGLSSERAWKVNGQSIRHVVSNSVEIYVYKWNTKSIATYYSSLVYIQALLLLLLKGLYIL